MAKIDLTKIDGYENMTAEEKLAALEGYDMPEADYSGWVKKEVFDKTASELAKVKKDSKTSLTASEQAMADMKSQMEEMQTTLNGYKREKDIANLTAQYTRLGYGDLAEATATALLDGDNETVFKNQKSVMDSKVEAAKQLAKETSVKETTAPPAGNPNDSGKKDKDPFLDALKG